MAVRNLNNTMAAKNPSKTSGFVGLGRLGLRLAANLLQSGFSVLGYRRSSMDDFVGLGGSAAVSVEEIGRNCDLIISCLPSESAAAETVQALIASADSEGGPKVLLDLSTLPLSFKLRQHERLEKAGIITLDGAVSGRPEDAGRREAVILISGPEHAVDIARSAVAAMTDVAIELGSFGMATKMKLLVNMGLAIQVLMTAELVNAGARMGFPPGVVVDVLNAGPVSFRQLAVRTRAILDDDGRLETDNKVRLFGKDLGIIDSYLEDLGTARPLFSAALDVYREAIRSSVGGGDTAVLFARMLDRKNHAGQRSDLSADS